VDTAPLEVLCCAGVHSHGGTLTSLEWTVISALPTKQSALRAECVQGPAEVWLAGNPHSVFTIATWFG
jgi:hypothetical protein